MENVYVVHHVREDPDGCDHIKFIGVYSARERAEEAVARLRQQPGFAQAPQGFEIERYEMDKDHWTEGYVDLSQE